MKAAILTNSGQPEVLQIKEIEKPRPKDNEVLIKIYATSVTSGDVSLRSFKSQRLFWFMMRIMYGLKKPKRSILGSELAGEIISVGKDVKLFKVGDEVFGSSGMDFGANAQYISLPEDGTLAIKPSNISYEEAASIPFGALASLYFLKKGSIQKGQKFLINGASGDVGVFAVQLVKYFGAEVTGVSSTKNLELVKSLGADTVIDYTKKDFKEQEELYDLIFDVVGKTSYSECKNVLTPKGKFVTTKKGLAKDNIEDFIFLKELIETKEIKPVIDRHYHLEEIAEAHRYVGKGQKSGSIVLTVEH